MDRLNRAGYTLVEMMVVVAVIAIVAALLVPALVTAKRMASGPAEISNMRQVYMAVSMYEEDNQAASPLLLSQVTSYSKSFDVLASPLDSNRRPFPDGTWTATPFVPCSGYRYEHKISYAYLHQFTPYDEDEQVWRTLRSDSKIGMLASPWLGTSARAATGSLGCGELVGSVAGPIMDGPIQRINMDGSLFRLAKHREPNMFGAGTNDLFFNR